MAHRTRQKQRKSYLVIGLGYFGEAVATRLYDLDQEVVGVDTNPDIIQRLADKLTQAIEMDATDEDALRALGVRNFDVCIVGRGSDLEDSVSITLNLKEQGAKYIIAKAMRSKHAKILERLDTDLIVFPEMDMAHQLAEALVHPKVVGQVDLGQDYVVEAIKATDRLVNMKVEDVRQVLSAGVKLVGIHRGDELIAPPDGSTIVRDSDLLLVWGKSSRIAQLEQ